MAENSEVSIITHLLEVEKQASQIIAAANIKSERKISEAKVAADNEFKSMYSGKAEELNNDFNRQKNEITAQHDSILSEYKDQVEKRPQNKEAFFACLDKVLFE